MPTAGELTIVLQAQNAASAQLQQVGQDVQRLERLVEGATRTTAGLGRAFGAVGQGLQAGLGFAAAQVGIQGIGDVIGFVGESVVGMNARLEESVAVFRSFTGSASEARRIVEALSHEADITPFDTREVIQAGQALISTAHGSQDAMMDLLRTAEQLAAFRPSEGLAGATFALREGLEGDLQSLRDRFGVSAQSIRNFQAQGMTALQAIRAELQRMGIDSRLVQELAQTFGGLSSNITSAFNEIRRRVGEGVFDRLKEGLEGLNRALEANRDAIFAWASRVGAVVGAVVGQVGGLLGQLAQHLLNLLEPGLGDRAQQLVSGMDGVAAATAAAGAAAGDAAPQVQALDRALSLPQARLALEGARGNLEALQTLATQTTRPVEQLARDLGAAGLAAAELQFQADRIRSAYDAQLAPLERQLQVLQQSADVQRVQNALAANRATVQRLQLEREIATLQQAAGARIDPAAPDLTPRQRAIALALQDRQLQLEQLGLEEDRRPVIQELQQRLQQLNDEQRKALEPIQIQIAAQKERVDLLQLERQRWEGVRGQIQEAIDAVNALPLKPKTAAPDGPEVEARKQELERIGKEFGERFQKGWKEWWDAGGGNLWGAITRSIQLWYEGGGKTTVDRLGGDIGAALGDAAGKGFASSAIPAVQAELAKNPLIQWIFDQTQGRQGAQGGAAAGSDLSPTARARSGLPPALPRVSPEGGGIGPNQVTGGGPNVSVTLPHVTVQLTAEERQARVDELTETVGREVAVAIVDALMASQSGTDIGANSLLPGAR